MPIAEDIVVVRAGALGDTVLALPAIRALRAAYPEATIRVAGNPDFWRIAGSLVDEVVSIDDPRCAGLLGGEPSPALHVWLTEVDLLVVWTSRDRAALAGTGARRVISVTPYPPPGTHAASWLLETLSLPHGDACNFRLAFGVAEREAAECQIRSLGLRRPILLHPGAGALWKCWPAVQFAALANQLVQRDHQVALVEGPADSEAVSIVQERLDLPLPVLREPSPRGLAALLSHAALYVGNDSGVTHLAAVSGTPTISLFGPTDPANWAPPGNSRVLRVCTAHTSEQGHMRVCQERDCMSSITVKTVLGACADLLVR